MSLERLFFNKIILSFGLGVLLFVALVVLLVSVEDLTSSEFIYVDF